METQTKAKAMTKAQTWDETVAILKDLGLYSNKNVLDRFAALLEPKKGGGGSSKRQPIMHNDENHYYCRFTGQYFPASEMVYQNPDKRAKLEDKGYSNIGHSIWNKGQKHIKDTMKLATEINFGIIEEHDGMTGDELRTFAMESYKTLEAQKNDNLFNQAKFLMDNFLTIEQAEVMEGLDLPEYSL